MNIHTALEHGLIPQPENLANQILLGLLFAAACTVLAVKLYWLIDGRKLRNRTRHNFRLHA